MEILSFFHHPKTNIIWNPKKYEGLVHGWISCSNSVVLKFRADFHQLFSQGCRIFAQKASGMTFWVVFHGEGEDYQAATCKFKPSIHPRNIAAVWVGQSKYVHKYVLYIYIYIRKDPCFSNGCSSTFESCESFYKPIHEFATPHVCLCASSFETSRNRWAAIKSLPGYLL